MNGNEEVSAIGVASPTPVNPRLSAGNRPRADESGRKRTKADKPAASGRIGRKRTNRPRADETAASGRNGRERTNRARADKSPHPSPASRAAWPAPARGARHRRIAAAENSPGWAPLHPAGHVQSGAAERGIAAAVAHSPLRGSRAGRVAQGRRPALRDPE